MDNESYVWVFCGEHSRLPSAVFSSLTAAKEWITSRGVSGVITGYPLDESAYDWAVRRGFFAPKRDEQRAPAFIQRFSSASQPHWHFIDGVCTEES
jgi:hypothetical protein